MRREIPVISVVAELVSSKESHASLDSLIAYADAPGDPPEGSKHTKALAWLRRANKDAEVDPLRILGRIVENYVERLIDPASEWDQPLAAFRDKIKQLLASSGLQYQRGGRIVALLGTPTRKLAEFIRDRDLGALEVEFQRATANAEGNPREAVSAAANILESVCKIYIEDEGLEMPSKQDLQNVWNPVALRTHSSSAHGAGRKVYKLEPRHARLAVHAAHTVTLFVLESWAKRQRQALQ